MRFKAKHILLYLSALVLIVLLATSLAQANEAIADEHDDATELSPNDDDSGYYTLDQAQLDQVLAPIALYPDSVLSHILVASTYPLETIQAARWRSDHQHLSESEAIEAVEEKNWDPSVKALIPFHDLLQQITDDLIWLQDVGDAFLVNEEQVLASIQTLRQRAYQQGNLENNQYIEVVEQDSDIIIEPSTREVVYIPYYDTRVVYGDWWWHSHPPRYWRRPAHYFWHAGVYWSPRIHISHNLFFTGFHWRNRHTVVHRFSHSRHRYDDGVRRVNNHEYQRWQHNPHHRRGVRYNRNTPKVVYNQERHASETRITTHQGQRRHISSQRPAQLRQSSSRGEQDMVRTQKRLKQQSTRVERRHQNEARQPRLNTGQQRDLTQQRRGRQTEKERLNQRVRQPETRQRVRVSAPRQPQSGGPKRSSGSRRHSTHGQKQR